MNRLFRLALLEFRAVARGRMTRLGLLATLLAGLGAVLHGDRVIGRQEQALFSAETLQAEQHRAILASQPESAAAADQLYYLYFHTRHVPSDWAPFALGQRDVQPFNLKIRLLALQGQLHESDLVSPGLASHGNFDASFVLVVLCPLLIIAFTYDLASSEREGGTWDLARAQGASERTLLQGKLALRAAVSWTPGLALIAGAALLLEAPFDSRLLAIFTGTCLYFGFWTACALLVASMRRASDFNLLALCGVWLATTVALPTLVNSLAALRVPVGEALELTVQQRHGYHSAWDAPLDETMRAFYTRYPATCCDRVPRDSYSNAWYYAMQQRGDAEAEPAFRAYMAAAQDRVRFARGLGTLIPSVSLGHLLVDVARTDADSHLAYLRSVAAYHESLKLYFMEAIFDGRPIREMDWNGAPVHRFKDESPRPLAGSVLPIFIQALVAALACALFGTRGSTRA